MNIGDVITFSDKDGMPGDTRQIGTIIDFDVYHPRTLLNASTTPLRAGDPTIQVLWQSGEIGWILSRRVKAIHENS
tara:strand:- start:5625 stop:5852 length:228 start_codon:yes stop_codon:yes gene_type:complete